MKMNGNLAKIHIGKKALGLDDDTYRAFLAKLTGKTSAKTLNFFEQQKVLNEMRRCGFKERSKPIQSAFKGKSLKKMQALWIAGWNLGLVYDRTDKALMRFIKKQTGLDHARFLFDPKDANKVVEGLKAWIGRSAGVDWKGAQPAEAIMQAQFKKLCAIGEEHAGSFAIAVEEIIGKKNEALTKEECQAVMNAFGARIRKARKDAIC